MKNAVVTPLKVDQFGRNFNWRYFTSSTTSMSNFVKIEALKTPKIAFEVSLNFTIFLNYIFWYSALTKKDFALIFYILTPHKLFYRMVKKNSLICKLHFHHPLTGQISSSFALWHKCLILFAIWDKWPYISWPPNKSLI